LNEDLKKLAQTLDGRKELIDTILMRELMYQQAQKEGVDKLKSVKLKINDLEKKVIVEAYLKKNINAKPLLSDVILKEYYNKNLDKYVTEEQFRISHIIVATETAAKEVLSKLNDNQSFKNLATRYSIDRAAYKGGDLGWFSEGNFIPEFEETALELDVGEISDIVKTKFGYHIIKLTGKRPAGQRSFAEVKRLIHDELKPIKEQELFDKMKKDLRKANNFKYRDNIIDNIDFYSNNTND
jgi:peptidyl-prolyl cis-trans isomerase C